MTVDYSQLANFIRDELQQFLCTIRQTENDDACRTATEQLWAAVNRVEVFAYAPSDEEWRFLTDAQRWGYLRLESYVGTAIHELRQRQRTVWRDQQTLPLNNETNSEALHAQSY